MKFILSLLFCLSAALLPLTPQPVKAASLSESEEAVAALISLGFSRAEAQSSVAKASALGASKLEDVISMALRSLS